MTLAPIPAAICGVRSVELLSTTITSSTKSGMSRNTCAMPSSSFRQGMMTVIEFPLYMHWYHCDCNEIGRILLFFDVYVCRRAPTGAVERRTFGLSFPDAQRP